MLVVSYLQMNDIMMCLCVACFQYMMAQPQHVAFVRRQVRKVGTLRTLCCLLFADITHCNKLVIVQVVNCSVAPCPPIDSIMKLMTVWR